VVCCCLLLCDTLAHSLTHSLKIIRYLNQFDKLLKTGFKEADIFDAFTLFETDLKKASDFLIAYKVTNTPLEAPFSLLLLLSVVVVDFVFFFL